VNDLFDTDAEAAIVGFCLMYPSKSIDMAVERGLVAGHFFVVRHQEVWQAMLARWDAKQPIDVRLIQSDLPHLPANAVDELTAWALSNAGLFVSYVERIVELALWRHRQHTAHAMVVACASQDEADFAACETDLGRTHRPDETTYSPMRLAEQLYQMMEGGEETFDWPFPRWNTLTSGGMRRGEVTLLGGWTSHGKSVMLDMILEHAAAAGRDVHLFINEMTPRQRAARQVARKSGVLLGDLLENKLNDKQRQLVIRQMGNLPFPITDAAGWDSVRIARAIRRLRADVVGIDILHLIEHRDERDIAGISGQINQAAKMADCHIIATVHLNENRVVGQTRPMPTLGDIRGSGMLKNDADNVLFVFREQDADTGYPQHEATGYFPKVRSGTPGGVPLTFNGARMEFTERGSWRTAA
jgi:replicative DNA helicase